MAERKHTPLTVRRFGKSYDVSFRIDAGGRFVCSVQGDNLEPSRLSIREAEEYASLFAAAPDMKQALQAAYAFILDQYSDPKAEALEGDPISAEARPVFKSICDALAKSEGDT